MSVISKITDQTMSSTEIAKLTNKRKNDIHQDIKTQIFIALYELEDGGNFHHEKIQGVTIILDNRGYWSEVLLDKYHTDILISGYEIKYRAAIVKRWHELEVQNKKPLSTSEILLKQCQLMVDLEHRQNQLEHKLEIVEAKITNTPKEYFTIAGFASLRGINVDVNKANRLGRKAVKLSKELGVDVGKTHSEVFGSVNTYHTDILSDIFDNSLVSS